MTRFEMGRKAFDVEEAAADLSAYVEGGAPIGEIRKHLDKVQGLLSTIRYSGLQRYRRVLPAGTIEVTETFDDVPNPEHLLHLALEPAMLLGLEDRLRQGPPSDEEIMAARPFRDDSTWQKESTSEAILFRTEPGHSAAAFSDLVRKLCLLACCPGGVAFMAVRYRIEFTKGEGGLEL